MRQIACIPDVIEMNLAGNPTVSLKLSADTVGKVFVQKITENDIEFRRIRQLKP